MKKNIGRSEFEKLCFLSPNELLDGAPPLVIKDNGIWIGRFSDQDTILLTKAEMAIVKDHPQQDLFRPALAFPCTVKEFLGFMRWALLKVYIDKIKLSPLIKKRHRYERKIRDLEILEPKKERHNKRMGAMAVEIEIVIDRLNHEGKPINDDSVFAGLLRRIEEKDSVCLNSEGKKDTEDMKDKLIVWFPHPEKRKELSKAKLKGRLARRSKRLKELKLEPKSND